MNQQAEGYGEKIPSLTSLWHHLTERRRESYKNSDAQVAPQTNYIRVSGSGRHQYSLIFPRWLPWQQSLGTTALRTCVFKVQSLTKSDVLKVLRNAESQAPLDPQSHHLNANKSQAKVSKASVVNQAPHSTCLSNILP